MPTLSTRLIKHPRAVRYCCECGLRIEGETVRLYGMAEVGDKPYALFMHRICCQYPNVLKKLTEMEQNSNPVLSKE